MSEGVRVEGGGSASKPQGGLEMESNSQLSFQWGTNGSLITFYAALQTTEQCRHVGSYTQSWPGKDIKHTFCTCVQVQHAIGYVYIHKGSQGRELAGGIANKQTAAAH